MNPRQSKKIPEKLIYLAAWLMVFTIPILLSPGRDGTDWSRVARELIRIAPFFLVFLLNNFVLFALLQSKKHSQYFLFAGIAVAAVSLLGSLSPLIPGLFRVPPGPAPPPRFDSLWMLNNFFYTAIFSVLVIGFNNAIKITFGWLEDKRNYEQLQKENLKNQLSVLQHQISPHFFLNTLNNIHALIDYDREIAKNSVVKLSQLMRVLLYENVNYTLHKEIDFLKDYIELMKIRVNENVEIKFQYPENVPAINFPPLLFISFVENSFKHGILPVGSSFIHIIFAVENQFLSVKIINSKGAKLSSSVAGENIGMNNSRRRLDLIYHKNYTYNVTETDATYEVNVKIPLYETEEPRH